MVTLLPVSVCHPKFFNFLCGLYPIKEDCEVRGQKARISAHGLEKVSSSRHGSKNYYTSEGQQQFTGSTEVTLTREECGCKSRGARNPE